MSVLKLFLNFAKRYRLVAVYYSLIFFLFISIFYVCSIPFQAVWYALLLSGVIGGFFLIYSFIQYSIKYRLLKEQEGRVLYDLDGLPEPFGEIEMIYQELLKLKLY